MCQRQFLIAEMDQFYHSQSRAALPQPQSTAEHLQSQKRPRLECFRSPHGRRLRSDRKAPTRLSSRAAPCAGAQVVSLSGCLGTEGLSRSLTINTHYKIVLPVSRLRACTSSLRNEDCRKTQTVPSSDAHEFLLRHFRGRVKRPTTASGRKP